MCGPSSLLSHPLFAYHSSPLHSSPSPPPHPRNSSSFLPTRCVVLPGVVLRRGSVLGSGSLAPEDFDMSVGSVWVSHLYSNVWNPWSRSQENGITLLSLVCNLWSFSHFDSITFHPQFVLLISLFSPLPNTPPYVNSFSPSLLSPLSSPLSSPSLPSTPCRWDPRKGQPYLSHPQTRVTTSKTLSALSAGILCMCVCMCVCVCVCACVSPSTQSLIPTFPFTTRILLSCFSPINLLIPFYPSLTLPLTILPFFSLLSLPPSLLLVSLQGFLQGSGYVQCCSPLGHRTIQHILASVLHMVRTHPPYIRTAHTCVSG